jgi:16S rRNA (uracil1498-N3)-methyltransferase
LARRRFFVDSIRDGMAELHGEDARHLARVLRAAPGQQYEISDNRSVWLAEIADAASGRVVFRVLKPVAAATMPLEVTLCAALIQFARFEWLIEKATELGAARILPVEAARTERGLLDASRKRTERWIRIAREASQQSRRVSAPEILPAVRFDRALAAGAGYRYFLEEGTAPPLLRVLPADRLPGAQALVIAGPEGGWTDGERQLAAAAGWQPVSLSPLVLRAETAAAAALALLAGAWMA